MVVIKIHRYIFAVWSKGKFKTRVMECIERINTAYRENFAPVLFSPSDLRANLKLD